MAFHPGNGTLQANYGHGTHYLCRIGGTYNGTSAEVCNLWASVLMTAQATQREIRFYYDDSLGSCDNLPNWAAPSPAPYHVSLRE